MSEENGPVNIVPTIVPICTSANALHIVASDVFFDTRRLMECELERSRLYEGILQSLYSLKLTRKDGIPLNSSKVNFLLLRYVFNKIADNGVQPGVQSKNDEKVPDVKENKLDDDPVFMTHVSSLAINQLRDDFEYFGIKTPSAKDVSDMIEKKFADAVAYLKNRGIPADGPVLLVEQKIMYKLRSYPDISSLGKNNPKYLKQALALQIRYKYLHLETYGLSNPYAVMGYKPDDKVIEGFGSAFNHYFNMYYSAFPDLEACFGSKGSFFNATIPAGYLTVCNPPFDASVMKCMIAKVLDILQTASEHGQNRSFLLTLPDWRDMSELTSLKTNKFCIEYKQIPQAHALFIESGTGKVVKPCNILQVSMGMGPLRSP
jgi:hypothetical protein